MRIARVEAWKCVFELPEPFPLGNLMVSHRDYVVVRIVTEDGTEGVAFGLSRGAPVDMVVTELLAPKLVGLDILGTAALAQTLAIRLPQHAFEGLVLRAISLVDIAVWDIKGKVAGKPVWHLLGGGEPRVAPILLVEGYHLAGEDDEGFATRLGKRAAEGYRALKIEASTTDREALSRRLEATRRAVGQQTELMIDLAYGWVGHDGAAVPAGWVESKVTWAEDPLHGSDLEGLQKIHDALNVPLAAGDEVTNPRALLALIQAGVVDVIRIDITCVGGISGFAELHQAATGAGVRISTHVYPELHQHVVLGYPDSGPVEMFPDNGGLWDATGQFASPVSVRRDSTGAMVVEAPTAPGLGLTIDWPAVEFSAIRHNVITAAEG